MGPSGPGHRVPLPGQAASSPFSTRLGPSVPGACRCPRHPVPRPPGHAPSKTIGSQFGSCSWVSGRPARTPVSVCFPGGGGGEARRAAGLCPEDRHGCRPAASRPPAVPPEGPGPPSLALQMLSPPPAGRALERNDVTVQIITHADGLEATGVSRNSEQKGRELENTGKQGTGGARSLSTGRPGRPRRGKRGGVQGSGSRTPLRPLPANP